MGDYRRLWVWQMGRELTKAVYEATRTFPKSEQFGLVSQMRRASASIGANIAEGFGRPSDRETARFIGIAIGSANELEQYLITANDVGLLSLDDASPLMSSVAEIRRMLVSLRITVRARNR